MNRSEIISTLNAVMLLLPEENEITDDLFDVIRQLEDEWIYEIENEECEGF